MNKFQQVCHPPSLCTLGLRYAANRRTMNCTLLNSVLTLRIWMPVSRCVSELGCHTVDRLWQVPWLATAKVSWAATSTTNPADKSQRAKECDTLVNCAGCDVWSSGRNAA